MYFTHLSKSSIYLLYFQYVYYYLRSILYNCYLVLNDYRLNDKQQVFGALLLAECTGVQFVAETAAG